MSMEVKGLDQLRSRMGNHANTLNSELKSAEREGLDLLRDEAKRLAPGSKLPNSIQREVLSDGLTGRVGSVARTAYSIEMGRPASVSGQNKWPSIELIQAWLVRGGQGIGTSQSIKTHRIRRPRKNSVAAQDLHDQAARVIYAMKQAGGTKPQPFIRPAAERQAKAVETTFQTHVQRALQKLAKG